MRQFIESFFEAWSQIVIKHSWLVLIGSLLLTFITVPQIRHGWIDVSLESFLPYDDPVIINYNDFRTTFDYSVPAVVVVEAKEGIFTEANLEKLRQLHLTFDQETPNLSEITSLYSMRYTRGEEDELVISDLDEIWPTTPEGREAFKHLVLNTPTYVGNILSADTTITTITLDPQVFSSTLKNEDGSMAYLQSDEESDFALKIFEITEQFTSPDFIVRSGGGPTMNLRIAEDMKTSSQNSTTLGLLIIIVLLALLFRRVSGVILPLAVVFLSLLMTMALWPALGYPYNGNTQVIPTFILAVGIADSIHILSIFYKYYDAGEEKLQAISHAVRETAIAVLLTTVTTAVGLLSFLASDMMPTRTLGIFGAIGVIMALFYTMALVPSILAITPIKRRSVDQQQGSSQSNIILKSVDKIIDSFSELGVNHAKSVVLVCTLISIVALAGILRIQFSHDPIEWYPQDNDLPQAIHAIDNKMFGSMSAYILLDTQESYGIQQKQVLAAIASIEDKIKKLHFEGVQVVDSSSILNVLRETNQALNNNALDAYRVPESQAMIAQELLLFESGSDDIYKFTDIDQRIARIDLRLRWSNVLSYREYIQLAQALIENELAQHGLAHVDAKLVGLLPIFGNTIYSLLEGTIQSYIMAFAFVCIIMLLLMGSVRRGLIAFSPNVFPILLTVGMIGWLDLPLNIITSTLGCVVIGISVDDTIHFMHHFRRYAEQYDDIKVVIHKTLQTCGRAIFFTSVVLVGGFIVHLTGELSINQEFAWLLSFAIIIALLANLILAPALMTLYWYKKKAN